MKLKKLNIIKITARFLIIALLIGSVSSCGFDANVGVDLNLPFDEIRATLAALTESAGGLLGQAGIEVRQTVGKVSDEIGNRLSQIESMGKNMWSLMYGDISKELASMKKFLLDYTKEVNKMLTGKIAQIDDALAARLDQISDMLTDTISQLDDLIQNTIKTAEESAINVIKTGETSTITILNNTAANIVRVVLIIIMVVTIVIIIVLALKNMLPKTVPAIVVSAVFGALLFGVCLTFIFSNKVMGMIFSKKIELVESGQAVEKALKSYDVFMAAVKANPALPTIKEDGKRIIRGLLSAKYVTSDAAIVGELEEKIQNVNVIIYPPPASSSTPQLGAYSKYYLKRVELLKRNALILKIKPESLYLSPERIKILK